MNSREFMYSPLAGALAENGWSIKCRDAAGDVPGTDTVIVDISYKDEQAGVNSGMKLSFRPDRLDNTDLNEVKQDFDKISRTFKEMKCSYNDISDILMDDNNQNVKNKDYLKNSEFKFNVDSDAFISVSLEADYAFLLYCNNGENGKNDTENSKEDVDKFVERAEDSMEKLFNSVITPYINGELTEENSIQPVGYVIPDENHSDKSVYEIVGGEVELNGRRNHDISQLLAASKYGGERKSFVKVSEVKDGERLPFKNCQCFEDEWVDNLKNKDIIINFGRYSRSANGKDIHFSFDNRGSPVRDAAVEKALNKAFGFDNRISVQKQIQKAYERLSHGNNNNDDPSADVGERRIPSDPSVQQKNPRSKSKGFAI